MSHYELDVGLLTVTDASVVSGPMRKESDLMKSCESALKILLPEYVTLPVEVKKGKHEGSAVLIKLPQPATTLPREKAPPKPKPLTSWQKFAIKKGIDIHRKKSNRVFDEERQVWKDKWGKRAREDREKYDWLREVKPGYVLEEAGGDPFLDEKRAKQSRLEAQKKKEEHNKRRSEHVSRAQEEVKHLMAAAQRLSTASNGKFEKEKSFKKGKKRMPNQIDITMGSNPSTPTKKIKHCSNNIDKRHNESCSTQVTHITEDDAEDVRLAIESQKASKLMMIQEDTSVHANNNDSQHEDEKTINGSEQEIVKSNDVCEFSCSNDRRKCENNSIVNDSTKSVSNNNAVKRLFTLSDVQNMHRGNPNRILIIVENDLYDLTGFAQHHPGGSTVLRDHSGTDATSIFQSVHGDDAYVELKH